MKTFIWIAVLAGAALTAWFLFSKNEAAQSIIAPPILVKQPATETAADTFKRLDAINSTLPVKPMVRVV